MILFDKPTELEIGVEFSAAWAMLDFAWREGQELIEAVAALTDQDLFEFENDDTTVSVYARRFGSRYIEIDTLARSFVSAIFMALSEGAIATKRCLAGAFLGEASRIKEMRFTTGDEFVDVIEAGHSCWPDELDGWPDSVPRPELGEVREFINQIIALNSTPAGWPALVSWVRQIDFTPDKDRAALEVTEFCPKSVAGMPKKKRNRDPKRSRR